MHKRVGAEQAHLSQVYLYYRLVDSGDIESILDLFAVQAVYHRPGYPPMAGRADLRRFYEYERVIDRGVHRIEEVVASHDGVAVRGVFNGILKSGKDVSLGFADFFVVGDDGRFVRRDTFFFVPLV